MDSFGSAWPIVRAAADAFRPPRRVSVSEGATRNLKIVQPGGYTGYWSASETPYMIEPMDLLASRVHEAVVFCGPARSGKTMGLLDAWFTYAVTCDMGDMLIVQMTQDKARDYSKTRIDRAIRHSPELSELMSSRGHDDNTHDKLFRHGMWLKIGWPSASQLASSDYRYVALTDYDRMPENVDGEGSAFQLGLKRTTTFLSRGMCMVESSPGKEIKDADWERPADRPHMAPPTTGILDLYNQGDRRRWYWQCPEKSCRQWFQPVLENFNVESERVFCPHCGCELHPRQKDGLNKAGRWVPEGCELSESGELIGTPRKSRVASFWMEGPAVAYQGWTSLAEKLKRAEETFALTDSQDDLKSVINIDWGRPYANRVNTKQRSSIRLMDRAEQTERRTVPAGVRFLIATVDVQGGENRRFVVQVHGFGLNKEMWLVDRFNIAEDRDPNNDQPPRQINPVTHPEDWDLLTRDVLARSYRLADGSDRRMPILAVGVDTGGEGGKKGPKLKSKESVTSQAYAWHRRLVKLGLADRVRLLKGGSTQTANRIRKTYPDNTGRKSRGSGARGDVPLYILGTDLLKDSVAAMMDRDDPGAGYMHIPNWLGRWWYEELTYEVRDPATGKWSKPGKKPNEAFDLVAYALAVLVAIGFEKINWSKPPPWAEDWDKNPLIMEPGGDKPAAKDIQPRRKPRRKVVKARI